MGEFICGYRLILSFCVVIEVGFIEVFLRKKLSTEDCVVQEHLATFLLPP